MLPVVCFGEALVDNLQTEKEKIDGLEIPSFRMYPGGAPANVSVAVAKLGGSAFFCGQVGQDTFGDFLLQALKHYGVQLEHACQSKTSPTAMAFVTLDAEGERHFEFLRHETADLLYEPHLMDWSFHKVPGFFHICSNTLTDDAAYKTTEALVAQAKKRGWRVSFDINFRPNLWEAPEKAPERILELLRYADLVKASREEVEMLWPKAQESWFEGLFEQGLSAILLTDGGNPVQVTMAQQQWNATPKAIQVVDTTGAGDAFIGGVLHSLSQSESLEESSIKTAVEHGLLCGAMTASRPGSYPALPWEHELS